MKTSLINNLNWRYATKKFDTDKKVSEEDLEELKEVLRLAPSSFGLQPWKFIIVTDSAIRNKLIEHSWGQKQITEASHLFVLCARTDINEAHIRKYVELIAKAKGTSVESLKEYENMMLGSRERKTDLEALDWASRQVYIALGFLMSACAMKQIDSCPMEGFDSAQYDKILNLEKKNLKSVVLLPVGYRAKDDKYANEKKVRFEHKDLFLKV